MTRFRATVHVTVVDEDAEMLHIATGIAPRTTVTGSRVPSVSAEINLNVESDDAADVIAQALEQAASLANERGRWQ